MNTDLNENIFRAYDIRGIFGSEITLDTAYLIGRAFGTRLIQLGKNKTIIGYDNRESSVPIFKMLSKGITDCGIDIFNLGLVTSPMYYYSWMLFNIDSGIMITASHNPKEYNGFKMSFNGLYNCYGDDIKEFMEFIKKGEFIDGIGIIEEVDIKEKYINFLLSSIKLGNKKIKIVVDSGNGTSSIVIKDILDRLDINYIPLFTDSDPNFPNHHPDPSVESNLETLKHTVINNKADVGFAYDGDADRIGLVDEFGNMINIDDFMIIIIRNIINNLPDKRILYDVKCSKSLEDEIDKLGGIKVCSRTGNSFLRAKVVQENILFGGELSGHVFFNDKFPGYDDGIYASLRMIEILSNADKSISQLLEGKSKYYSTRELKVTVSDDKKFDVIDQVKLYCNLKKYDYLDIDGCKVIFDDGFALIRASNTGPNITLRFEGNTELRLKEIKDEFESLLNKII